jgi:hypothetical protein
MHDEIHRSDFKKSIEDFSPPGGCSSKALRHAGSEGCFEIGILRRRHAKTKVRPLLGVIPYQKVHLDLISQLEEQLVHEEFEECRIKAQLAPVS